MTDLQKSRQATHGDFGTTSHFVDIFTKAVTTNLPPSLRYAYTGIAIKMARILSGDSFYEDHWRDISGFAEEALKIVMDAKEGDSHE